MSQYFNPLEYIYTPDGIEDQHMRIVAHDGGDREDAGFRDAVRTVRDYLRENHSSGLASAVIDPETRESMKREIMYFLGEAGLSVPGLDQGEFFQRLQEEILYYGPIQRALDDPAVTNIDINSYQYVYLERNGDEEYHPEMKFQDEAHLEVILNKMLMTDGKALTANEPHIDSLFEKFRICAVLGSGRGGIATEGTCASIRKFSDDTITPAHLVAGGSISREMDEFFSQVLPWCNAIIAGATNSGKTTTLMAIPLYFSPDTRIITIEDSPEMMLRRRSSYRDYYNIVALQTKDHENKEKRFDIARLTKVSLRMRPVKVMVGEVRDSQACRQAHESMNTGHNTYFTIHASSAANAAVRIVQLAGDGYNDEVIAAQLADTVDLILFQQKMGKSRVISEVAELIGYEGARKPVVRSIFRFEQTGLASDGYVVGNHRRLAGISDNLAEKLHQALVDPAFIRRWQSQPDDVSQPDNRRQPDIGNQPDDGSQPNDGNQTDAGYLPGDG
ncbi:MAG: Flp pilus assembly complex ATPase component TadA [Peptococcaceae bacterium]|jgi:pilus assembly protein CpaF|nr:Flp pilus assembly complex ATPase component TadA [Peptococcaceae bacterium]